MNKKKTFFLLPLFWALPVASMENVVDDMQDAINAFNSQDAPTRVLMPVFFGLLTLIHQIPTLKKTIDAYYFFTSKITVSSQKDVDVVNKKIEDAENLLNEIGIDNYWKSPSFQLQVIMEKFFLPRKKPLKYENILLQRVAPYATLQATMSPTESAPA